MFNYDTLENIGIETLHKTFLNAFSDYQVKMDLPILKFQYMLQRRGYVAKASIGAFNDDILVGFVLNGVRNWDGKLTAYDTGTGVIETYRKQGITSNMLLNVRQLFKEMEVEQYLLEVIQSNTSAFQIYKKQGFKILRDFECFHLDKNKYNPITTYKVEHINMVNPDDWRELKGFWDFVPSWQNSIDSINAVSDAFIYSVVRLNDSIVGYGVIDKKTGDIPQIAVNKNYRCKGIASSIITDLIKNTESNNINVINVDGESKPMKDFLLKLGFQYGVSQYEMILKL
ncbi:MULTISPECIES: GNAT family N-acetyltransferase [Clostridium]|uniref:GNAT family N-acetyltransferase n=1 Tax=Clostridium sporogenes TaxID=1509 RepID=A0A7X5PCG5_CLOSG|nr:GNAT family N-acetyltransferase [Clostridium sporogenes]AJD32478.1 acetyltransferase domain protein [Clostridium botulinum Prevot_594]KRU41385.1 GNAT family acetyltransferase [Clostridium sporogenes]MBY7013929.1 GNAT family N-acetyltransferase [Clostridium sporogenes]MBY7063203.1 GNAT family N-acetyltransferase [Clostridium sporogenes]MBY7068709.1 GNAT family N-acetyltransferase [Clostridium sporogenes]